MGVYSRDYMRDERGSGGFDIGRLTVVGWLIIANIGVYLFTIENSAALQLSRDALFGQWKVYTLLTCLFAHENLLHLGINMLWLYFVGRALLRQVGTRNFLAIYFLGGIVGGLLHVLIFPAPVIGASGATFALLCGLTTLMPNLEIRLIFPPIALRLKYLAYFLVGISFLMFMVQLISSQPARGADLTSHISHLGGALLGWTYVRFFLPLALDRRTERGNRSRWAKRFGAKRVVEAEVATETPARPAKKRRKETGFVSQDVDAILDKISAHGMQSLTAEEKKILEKGSEKLARKLEKD